MHYLDGFVLSRPKKHLKAYVQMAQKLARIGHKMEMEL